MFMSYCVIKINIHLHDKLKKFPQNTCSIVTKAFPCLRLRIQNANIVCQIKYFLHSCANLIRLLGYNPRPESRN